MVFDIQKTIGSFNDMSFQGKMSCFLFFVFFILTNASNLGISTQDTTETSSVLFLYTMDGQVHAFNEVGSLLWVSSTGGPVLSFSAPSSPKEKDLKGPIPGLDGSLLSQDTLTPLPLNVRDLVSAAPFNAGDGFTYLGSKTTKMWGIEKTSGHILASFSQTKDQCSGENGPVNHEEALWITRTDYLLQAVDRTTGREVWNVSFGEFNYEGELEEEEDPGLEVRSDFSGVVKILGLGDLDVELDLELDSPLACALYQSNHNRIYRVPIHYKDRLNVKGSTSLVPYYMGSDGSKWLISASPGSLVESQAGSQLISLSGSSVHLLPSVEMSESIDDDHVSLDTQIVFNLSLNSFVIFLMAQIAIALFVLYLYGRKSSPSRKIQFDTSKPLGMGSHGTIVFEGTLEGRPVAVKRILSQFYPSVSQEIELLIHSDAHPNVLRYFYSETDGDFFHIALEKCSLSLTDYIASHSDIPFSNLQSIILQSLRGIGHLHSLGIVHRDIKPHNILLKDSTDFSVKVADMGLGKRIEGHGSSFDTCSSAGSSGWTAPEVLQNVSRQSTRIDVFSMGCVVYYVLSGGKHPFGDLHERDHNILLGKYSISDVSSEAYDLIEQMIQSDPLKRPRLTLIEDHPFLWSSQRQLDFLCAFSDCVETVAADSLMRLCLEQKAVHVVGVRWDNAILPELLENLGKYRKYNFSSVRDLLRVIRNKRNHYRDLPDQVKAKLGSLPNGFLSYFKLRFPQLLLFAYYFVRSDCGQSLKEFPLFHSQRQVHPPELFKERFVYLFQVSEEKAAKVVKRIAMQKEEEEDQEKVYSKNWRRRKNHD